MPHKRAKRSVRERRKSQTDIAPGPKYAIANEAIPKSVARVLNAAKVQHDYAERKRRREGGDDVDGSKPSVKKKRASEQGIAEKRADKKAELKILPGESIAAFNRRVENAMRSEVRTAVKTSSAHEKKFRKEEQVSKAEKSSSSKKAAPEKQNPAENDDAATPPQKPTPKGKERAAEEEPKEFQRLKTSAPKRLNDIVQAPPEFNKQPRGATKGTPKDSDGKSEKQSLKEGVASMAQKAMLEEERLRVVKLYREMKKAKMGG